MALRAILALLLAAGLAGQVNVEPRPRPASKKQDPPTRANIRVTPPSSSCRWRSTIPSTGPYPGWAGKPRLRDKIGQKIVQFAMDDEPVAVGLVFDTSGSMGDKLSRSRMAAKEFFHISNPEDEFFLVEFDNSPRLVVQLTSDTGTIEDHLAFSRSKGSTALLDAIYLALHEMKRSKKNKKALLIISDGGDNHSRYSQREVTNVVKESDTLIYSIACSAEEARRRSTAARSCSPRSASRRADGCSSQRRGTTGYRQEDRDRTAQSVHPRIFAPESDTRRKYHRIEVKMVPPRGLPESSTPTGGSVQRAGRIAASPIPATC